MIWCQDEIPRNQNDQNIQRARNEKGREGIFVKKRRAKVSLSKPIDGTNAPRTIGRSRHYYHSHVTRRLALTPIASRKPLGSSLESQSLVISFVSPFNQGWCFE